MSSQPSAATGSLRADHITPTRCSTVYYLTHFLPQASLNLQRIRYTSGTLWISWVQFCRTFFPTFFQVESRTDEVIGRSSLNHLSSVFSPTVQLGCVGTVLACGCVCVCASARFPGWNWLQSPIWCRRSPARCPLTSASSSSLPTLCLSLGACAPFWKTYTRTNKPWARMTTSI